MTKEDIEKKAMRERLKSSGISPDTIDIKSLDSKVSYSERVRDVEELTGKTLKTKEEEKKEIKGYKMQAGEYSKQAEQPRNEYEPMADWEKQAKVEKEAKEVAKAREEGYKKEGDVLGKHFAMSAEETRKKEHKAVTFLKGVGRGIAVSKEKAIKYVEERTPITPISGERHIAHRGGYLAKTVPVYEQEAKGVSYKHQIKISRLEEERKRLAIAQAQKALQKPYYKPTGQAPSISPDRMSPRNLPFLGDVAVIKREGGGLLSQTIRPNAGLLTPQRTSMATRTRGPDWRGKGGLDWRSPKKG